MKSSVKILMPILVMFLITGPTLLAAIVNVPDDFALIQDAIDVANPGDTVLVQPNTYNVHLTINNKDIVLASLFLTSGDPNHIATTILDGGGNGNVISIDNMTAAGLITGFTIQNAVQGVHSEHGVANLSHLVLKDHNNPGSFGAGLHCRYGELILTDSEIYDCVARDGGGICLDYLTAATLERVDILHNVAQYGGGLRILQDCTLDAKNVLFSDNLASRYGGGIQVWAGNVTLNLTNCTFYNNVDQMNNGGGFRTRLANDVTVVNCIFDNNVPKNIFVQDANSDLDISYSDIVGGQGSITNSGNLTWGDGNIDQDPLFVDPDNDDFHIAGNSPCLDAGDPNSTDDPDGTTADQGRYYFHQFDPPVVDVTYPDGGEDFDAGEIVTITWDVTSVPDITGSVVEYSLDGGDTWLEIGSTEADDFDLDWEVPDLFNLYVVVRVMVTDELEGEDYDISEDWFTIGPTQVTHEFYRGWSFFSLPHIPEDGSVATLIEAGIIDQLPWDLFGFEMATSFYRPDHLVNGFGYALSMFQDTLVTTFNCTANREQVDLELDFGWNLIGVPFGTSIDVADLRLSYEGHDYSIANAANEHYCVPVFYKWSAVDSMYVLTDPVAEWNSYFFLSLVEGAELQMLPAPPGPVPALILAQTPGTFGEWELNFTTTFDGHTDVRTTIGANAYASDGFDPAFDYPEPPLGEFSGVVKAFFHQPEWLPDFSQNFNTDIREEMLEGQAEWNLSVTTIREGEVTLTWEELGLTTPPGYEFELIDQVAEVTLDLRVDHSYTFHNVGTRELIVRAQAYLGADNDQSDLPDAYELLSAYPNPFNSMTTISYAVQNSGKVTLDVFDMSGKLIQNLVHSETAAGNHQVNWNASQQAAGIYLIRMQSGTMNTFSKVVLVK